MNILLLGSGGREHALAWKIAASPLTTKLWCAPGNAGIAREAECVPLDITDHAAVVAFCKANKVDFVVVGPEAPLVAGIVDDLEAAGLRTFGPTKAAARLEGSKGFTKDLCRAHDIPTGAYQRFTSAEPAKAYARKQATPIVIKADGLAAGKGVIIAETIAEAEAAIDMMFGGGLGDAGTEVVIEEFLRGEEASFFALCDGETAIPLASAQDHKRAFDNDKGPNTGGMGAYSPAPVMTAEMSRRTMDEIVLPTVRAMKQMGAPFSGILFAGLMITAQGPKLIEYNVRFGDPECQVLMLRHDVRPPAGADRGARRAIAQFRPALARQRGARGRDGDQRLSGQLRQRLGDRRARRRRRAAGRRRSSTPAPSRKATASRPMAGACSASAPPARRSARRSSAPTRQSTGSTGRADFAAATSAISRSSREKQ